MCKDLEEELKVEWVKYQNNAHEDDKMSFIDYVSEIHTFRGHRVIVERNNIGMYKIIFKTVKN